MALGARKIAITGVLSAVIIVLGISRLGFIPLPMGAATILHVPVIIGAILEGPVVGLIIGFLFGLFSLIQAAMAATTLVDLAFVKYPFIAIVPRILIGPAAWALYSLVSGAFFRKTGEPAGEPGGKHAGLRESLSVILGAALGSMVNTVLVLSAIAALYVEVGWQAVIAIASLNGSIEAGFAAVISLAVILAWKRVPSGRSRLHRERR